MTRDQVTSDVEARAAAARARAAMTSIQSGGDGGAEESANPYSEGGEFYPKSPAQRYIHTGNVVHDGYSEEFGVECGIDPDAVRFRKASPVNGWKGCSVCFPQYDTSPAVPASLDSPPQPPDPSAYVPFTDMGKFVAAAVRDHVLDTSDGPLDHGECAICDWLDAEFPASKVVIVHPGMAVGMDPLQVFLNHLTDPDVDHGKCEICDWIAQNYPGGRLVMIAEAQGAGSSEGSPVEQADSGGAQGAESGEGRGGR